VSEKQSTGEGILGKAKELLGDVTGGHEQQAEETIQGETTARAATVRQGTGAPQTTATTRIVGSADTTRTDATDRDIEVPVYEEELTVGKQREQIGDVHLRKDVVQEQQTVSVPLQHEEVTVERVPVSGQVDAATVRDAFQGGDIEVPVMGEEAVVGKKVVETEEVRLHKQAVTQDQTVSDTVRKERVIVDGVEDQTTGTDLGTTRH